MDKDVVLSVAGNLCCVSLEVPEEWSRDVVDSMLFARLYADSNADRFSASQEWYKCQSDAMSQLKWGVSSNKSSTFQPGENSSFLLKSLIEDKMGLSALANSPLAKQLQYLFRSVQQGEGEQIVASLPDIYSLVHRRDTGISTISTVVAQVSLVGKGTVLYTAFVSFKTTEKVCTDFFSQKFSGELVLGEVVIIVAQLVLNKARYEKFRIREKVISSLPEAEGHLVLFSPGAEE